MLSFSVDLFFASVPHLIIAQGRHREPYIFFLKFVLKDKKIAGTFFTSGKSLVQDPFLSSLLKDYAYFFLQ